MSRLLEGRQVRAALAEISHVQRDSPEQGRNHHCNHDHVVTPYRWTVYYPWEGQYPRSSRDRDRQEGQRNDEHHQPLRATDDSHRQEARQIITSHRSTVTPISEGRASKNRANHRRPIHRRPEVVRGYRHKGRGDTSQHNQQIHQVLPGGEANAEQLRLEFLQGPDVHACMLSPRQPQEAPFPTPGGRQALTSPEEHA